MHVKYCLFTTTEIRKDKATGKETPIVIMLNGKVVEGIDVKEEGSEYQYEIWFNTGKVESVQRLITPGSNA